MAKSLRSKRRRKNKQVMRAKLKPKYDAQMASIVKTMQEQTDELMETIGDVDLSNEIKIVDPDAPVQTEIEVEGNDMDTDNKELENKDKKIKIPRVDIKKVAKFMSQRKYRSYQAKEKIKKKQLKGGKKKQKTFKW